MRRAPLQILLIDPDTASHAVVAELLGRMVRFRADLTPVADYNEGLEHLADGHWDVVLVADELGGRTGLELLAERVVRRTRVSPILLGAAKDLEAEAAAAEAGAVDYLARPGLTAEVLERSILYAVEASRRQRAEGLFEALVENSRDLVSVLGPGGRVEYVSPSLQEMLGFGPHEKAGANALDEVHPDDRPAVARAFQRLLEEPHRTRRLRYRVAHRDGSWRVLDTIAQNFFDDPLIRGVVVNSWDVTELMEAREEQRRLLALIESTPEIVAVTNADRTLRYVNRAGRRLAGLDADDPLDGRDLLSLFADRMAHDAATNVLATARREGTWSGETMLRAPDGGEVPVWGVVIAHRDEGAGAPFFTLTARDLTEYKRATRRIEFQADLLDAVGQAVIATDTDGRVTYWNRAAESLYGWSREEALGENILELTPSETTARQARQIMEALRRGETWTGEFEVRRKDGASFPALVTDAPITDDEGRLTGIIGISSDLTDRKRLEAQFHQAQKMQAIGRLASGVAHDFNNVLTAITGNAEMLLGDLPEQSPLRHDAQEIRTAAERGTGLTRQLLAFSRKQVLDVQVHDLGALALDLEPMLRRLVPERIGMVVEAAEPTPAVQVDPVQIHQVLLNLVVNASDAIEGTGRIEIRVDRYAVSDAEADTLACERDMGVCARLAVEDTGTGIPDEHLEHVFEPFYTTKSEGQGTGLGLSTVFGIVQQSGGHIRVESTPGEGTRFEVLLPLAGEAASETATATGPASEPGAGSVREGERETILVVEDDDAVRGLARRVLDRAGFRVIEARDGREALRHVERDGIDLVVTDLVMPDVSGSELVRRLRDARSELPVIVISGFGPAEVRRGLEGADVGFLPKPFTPATLRGAIEEALGA